MRYVTRRMGMGAGLLAVALLGACGEALTEARSAMQPGDPQYQIEPSLAAYVSPDAWVERSGSDIGPSSAMSEASVSPTATNAVANGLFEAGFRRWTVVDQAGGSGSWYVHSGPTSPISLLPVVTPSDPPQALSDQTGPGSHLLYQDVTIPSTGGTLTFDLTVENRAGVYYNPRSLDFGTVPNQQFRVDIISPTAPVYTTSVLQRVYITERGMPVSFATRVSASMAAFKGQTVRLRFAEVDNQLFFNVGIDNVRIR